MNYEYLSMDTLEENRKLLGEVERLRNEKQELFETIDMITNDASEYVKRIDKALKLLDSYKLGKYDYALTCDGLLEFEDILKGEDNE